MVVVDLLQEAHELLDGVVLELALAEVGLLDEELDISLLLLLGDALVGIWGDSGIGGEHGALIELRGGDDAVGNLHGGNLHLLLAQAGIEGEVHLGFVAVEIVEGGLQRIVAADAVGDNLVVAGDALALEGGGVALYHLSVGIAELGHDGDDGLLLHVFLGELSVDGCGHDACLCLKRIGGDGEIVGREGAEFRTRGEEQRRCCKQGKGLGYFHKKGF